MANTLPTIQKIQSWNNEHLLEVIRSGESISWNIGLGESQEEIDEYVICLYAEKENRNI